MPEDITKTPIRPNVQPKPINIPTPKEPPAEFLKRTFSVEQMPEMENSEASGVSSADAVAVGESGKPTPSPEVKLPKADIKPGEGIVPPKEEKKEVELKVVPKEEDGEKKEEPSPIAKYLKPPKGSKDAKLEEKKDLPVNYEEFTAEEVSHLKKMDNTAKVFTAGLIKKAKELEKLKGAEFFQHDNAYTLDPGYQGAVAQHTLANKEATHWMQQLENCKNGRDVQLIKGWDANGNAVMGEVIKASDPRIGQVEESLRQDILNCRNVAKDIEGKVNTFVTNFKSRIQQDNQSIQAERQKRFEWQANPKLLDYSIETPDGKENTIRQVRDGFITLFPSVMRETQGVQTAADLMVSLVIANAEIRELKKGKSVAEIKVEESKRAEPTSELKGKNNSKPVHGVTTFSVADAGVEL